MIAMLTTMHAAYQICWPDTIWWLERYFYYKLLGSDYKNMSFTDHLEHYLNQNWTEENSFCMDGEPSLGPTEVHAGALGLCFILNSKEKIYSQRWTFFLIFLIKKRSLFLQLQLYCSAFQHVSGNFSTKCMHSSRIKNGMTIELNGRKSRKPTERAGDEVSPFVCKSELGIPTIHSKERFSPLAAALSEHKKAYSLIVTPKISTSDDSLRNFHPKE